MFFVKLFLQQQSNSPLQLSEKNNKKPTTCFPASDPLFGERKAENTLSVFIVSPLTHSPTHFFSL